MKRIPWTWVYHLERMKAETRGARPAAPVRGSDVTISVDTSEAEAALDELIEALKSS